MKLHKSFLEKAKAKAKATVLKMEKDSTKECKMMNLQNFMQASHANIARKEDIMTPNVGSNTQS